MVASRQTELERGAIGVVLGIALGALIGLLSRNDDPDGGPWAARSRT